MGAGGMGGKVDAGEASFVEVAPGHYLFALLGEDMEDLAFDVFFDRKGRDQKELADQIEVLRATREVPREHYPLLVTFDDINDPTTVKRVDPDDLAASFGPGVSLNRITLTITDEPVARGDVEAVLEPDFFRTWAGIHQEALERGGINDPYFGTFASDLRRNNFIQE
jgi:hypothetical protein